MFVLEHIYVVKAAKNIVQLIIWQCLGMTFGLEGGGPW
jgi:hypothetical protein